MRAYGPQLSRQRHDDGGGGGADHPTEYGDTAV